MKDARNAKARAITIWADLSDVDLDNAEIDLYHDAVSFHHRRETADNMRAVKRACGGFKVHDSTWGDTELRADVEVSGHTFSIRYEGAFHCETTRRCSPAPFEDGGEPVVEDAD